MKTNDWNLTVQAHVDGELPADQAGAVGARIQQDAESRHLAEELASTRELLALGEPEHKLAESREFYWSKIQRQIDAEARAQERAARAPRSGVAWWLRFVVPAAAVALLLALAVPITMSRLGARHAISFLGHEIDSPLDETSTISFYSQADAMTVVWVQGVDN